MTAITLVAIVTIAISPFCRPTAAGNIGTS